MFSKPLTSISAGSSCLGVELDAQQIVDGRSVLGARHALHRHVAGYGASNTAGDAATRGAIELRLHPRHERVDLALIRLAASGRRHQPATQLAHGGFPDVGVILNRVQGQGVERHTSGMDRRAVAPGAVGVERLARLLRPPFLLPLSLRAAAVVAAAATPPVKRFPS